MVTVAGISFGLLAGALVCLFLHPVFRQKLAAERRTRLLRQVLASLVGAGIAGGLLGLLGRDAVVGYLLGVFPGFLLFFGYLEWRQSRLIDKMARATPRQKQAMLDVLRGKADAEDPTTAAEFEAMLDALRKSDGDGAQG